MTHPEHHSSVYELADSGVFEIPQLPDWFREPGIDDAYRPWQHTPLDPYSGQMKTHQAALRDTFRQLAMSPPLAYRSHDLEELVDLNILAGMATRETLCKANFNDWQTNHLDELEALRNDPVMEWLLGEGLAGHGSARGQLEILRRAPSLRSLDLQVLTTPFGYRYEYVDDMRGELLQALDDLDAMVYDEPQWLDGHPPKIAVDPSRRAHTGGAPRGILVTFKRKVAEVADSARNGESIIVLQREAWLLPTHRGSGFSPEVLDVMWNEPSWEHTMKEFATDAYDYVMQKIALRHGAMPLSVATYATRPQLDKY